MHSTATSNDESSHSYSGLQKADTNRESWFDFREIDDEDFDSDSDWRKTKKQSYYKFLDHQNRGYANGKRRNKPFYTYQANLHLSQALSGRLGLTSKQRSEAEKWFRLLDFQKLGHPSHLTGFSICARIVHETESDDRTCHPQTPIEDWPQEFRKEYESFETRYQDRYEKVYGQVDHQMRNWSFRNNTPASKRMDKYDCYEAQLHHRSEKPKELW